MYFRITPCIYIRWQDSSRQLPWRLLMPSVALDLLPSAHRRPASSMHRDHRNRLQLQQSNGRTHQETMQATQTCMYKCICVRRTGKEGCVLHLSVRAPTRASELRQATLEPRRAPKQAVRAVRPATRAVRRTVLKQAVSD
jgi:hypothetical protein